MHDVRAALGDDADVAAEGATQLRLTSGRHDLKLIDSVNAIRNAAHPRGIVIGRQAVDDEVVRKLRWLPNDSPCPGTADISANSCVLPMFVGDTPGTSNARSRKLRPFIGRFSASCCEMVLAIWLRAASRTVDSATTSTVAATPASARVIGSSERRPHRHLHRAHRLGKARHADRDVVTSQPQIGKIQIVRRDRSRFRAFDSFRFDARSRSHRAPPRPADRRHAR